MNQDILARNNVRIFGEGDRPMLLAHGFGCDQNMWRFITPEFAANYKIILFDYVGSGKSDLQAYSPERYSELKGYVQDILEICESLALKDMIFVGHSVSSIVGILASIQAPHLFERLVLIGPSPCYINDLPNYFGGFERKDIEDLLESWKKITSVGRTSWLL